MTGNSENSKAQDVKRRQVFYIPGYDPMLPRRYRELYRTEGAFQADISDYTLELKGLQQKGNYSWSVRSDIDNYQTATGFEFLLWSDIVQSSMDRNIPATFLMLIKVVWIYVSTGALFRLMRLRKGPVIAALYPVFMLSFQLILAIGLGWVVASSLSLFAPLWLSLPVGILALGWLMRWFRARDNRLYAYYLLHDYAFSSQFYGAYPESMCSRMDEFGDRILAALESDVDEVLVVGHSSGAHLGISILADLLRRDDILAHTPKLAFLTLGQVVPMMSYLPKADKLRADLHFLSQQNSLTWVDVTAPGDGCTFALCDPVAVSGAATSAQLWPLVMSASFTQSLSADLYKSLKWRFFRLHFQYLCAFDQPKDYDYFQITAGPISLGARYKDRPQSPSRILTAHSDYQSRAAP